MYYFVGSKGKQEVEITEADTHGLLLCHAELQCLYVSPFKRPSRAMEQLLFILLLR